MAIRFGMVVLYVRDLDRSLAFYRQLGLELPDPQADRPVVVYRMNDAVTLILTTDAVARRFDADWTWRGDAHPGGGYQQVIEFFVDDDTAVDEVWARMTGAGYRGRTAPGHLLGPYATLIEDPDGNVVLVTHEPAPESPAE